jgi:hypothetical protein
MDWSTLFSHLETVVSTAAAILAVFHSGQARGAAATVALSRKS